MKLTVNEALIATFAIGFMMFLLRLLPFLIFARRKTPKFFSFIEKFIPALSIAVLFIACLKSYTTDLIFVNGRNVDELSSIICAFVSVFLTVLLHVWKNNAMISIFGGTLFYMILNYLF